MFTARVILSFLALTTALFLVGCSPEPLAQTLINTASKSDDPIDQKTALITLSNLSLNQSDIDKLSSAYASSQYPLKTYYAYTLARRTQQSNYIEAFINHAAAHPSQLHKNDTLWASINNPMYAGISLYSTTDDTALKVLLELSAAADGAHLLEVSSDIAERFKTNPRRVIRVATQVGMTQQELNALILDN